MEAKLAFLGHASSETDAACDYRVDLAFIFAAAAYNLICIPRSLKAAA